MSGFRIGPNGGFAMQFRDYFLALRGRDGGDNTMGRQSGCVTPLGIGGSGNAGCIVSRVSALSAS